MYSSRVIRGEPGLGKTLLAESLRPHVEGDDGYFVHAKFHKLSYDTSAGRPYSEISAAVAEFCSELRKRDEDTREEVSRALKKKISREEGDVLVEAIPSLQAVLGYSSWSGEEKLSDSMEDITCRAETSAHKLPFIMKKFMSGISTGRYQIYPARKNFSLNVLHVSRIFCHRRSDLFFVR